MIKRLFLFYTLMLLFYGCDSLNSTQENEYERQYVVDAYLVADKVLPHVWVNKTSPIDQRYSSKENSVQDANVQIRLLNEDGSVAKKYQYELKEHPGHYLPVNEALVKPERRYQLYISFPNHHTIEAKTTVPSTFVKVNPIDSSYVYKEDKQINFITTPSKYPGRNTYYLFTAKADNNNESNLTPFYKDLVKKKGSLINNYFINSTEITSGNNYQKAKNRNVILPIPWSLIAFYGTNEIAINAIDDNIYDTWPIISPGFLSEGLDLSPGEMDQLPNHINGAIGIFGSMARIEAKLNILKNEAH